MFSRSFHPRGSAAVLLLAIALLAGCVSIYDDKVQVQRPEEIDSYQRNILDKCRPHQIPHRFLMGTMSAATTLLAGESLEVRDQAAFDLIWNNLIPDLTGAATPDLLKPSINWEVQAARFIRIPTRNSCDKVKAYGMESDCYQINLPIYRYVEGSPCIPTANHPVFLYIHPRTNLPIRPLWSNAPYLTPTPGREAP